MRTGIGKPQGLVFPDPAHPLNRGLVLDLLASEGCGGSAYDFSGRGHNATFYNDTTWKVKENYSGMYFDGADDYAVCTSTATLDDIDQITFSAWIYKLAGGNNYARVFDKNARRVVTRGSGASAPASSLQWQQVFGTATGTWRTPADSLPEDQWNFVVISYDRTSTDNDPSMWVNGESQTITEAAAPSGAVTSDSGDDIYIGNSSALTRDYKGYLSHYRVYDRLFSDDEAAWLYELQSRGGVELYLPKRNIAYFWISAGEIITVPTVGLGWAGQSFKVNESVLLAKDTLSWQGKSIQANEAPVIAKAVVTWSGKDTSIAEAPTIAKGTLSWTGKTVLTKLDVVVQMAKGVLSWTGKNVFSGTTVQVTKAALSWAGAALNIAESVLILKLVVSWTGKTVQVIQGGVVQIGKVALYWAGKTFQTVEVITISKAAINWAGKVVAVAGGLIHRGLSRLGLTIRAD